MFKDNFSRIMFSAFSHNNELKHREYILPSNWLEGYLDKDMQKLQNKCKKNAVSKSCILH